MKSARGFRSRPADWPRCPMCGKPAPEEFKNNERWFTELEELHAEELRRRSSAGERLPPKLRRLASCPVGTLPGSRDNGGHGILRGVARWKTATGKPIEHWGYPIHGEPLHKFCTLVCARDFAGAAFRAGYRVPGFRAGSVRP